MNIRLGWDLIGLVTACEMSEAIIPDAFDMFAEKEAIQSSV